jgi:hypothetical protein
MRCTLLFLVVGVSLLVFGCGSKPSIDNHVTGNVTFDGRRIGDGTVTFTPKEGKGPPVSSTIKGGLFVLGVLRG